LPRSYAVRLPRHDSPYPGDDILRRAPPLSGVLDYLDRGLERYASTVVVKVSSEVQVQKLLRDR
jgi:hypothetical protein